MAEAFEYAIKKDVRNNPIVREVDETRQRELLTSIGIGAVFVLMLLFWAGQHFELLVHGYKTEELQRQMAVENERARRLRLDIETLRSPARIEKIATETLRMVAPSREEAVIIERIVPAQPPARSVVARR